MLEKLSATCSTSSKKHLTPSCTFYNYKSQIKPKSVYCCYKWTGADQSSFLARECLKSSASRCEGWLIFRPATTSYRPNVASLSLPSRYFHVKYSDEHQVQSVFQLKSAMLHRRNLTIFTAPPRYSNWKSEFYPETFSLKQLLSVKRLPRVYFPARQRLQARDQLLHIFHIHTILTFFFLFLD